MRIVALLTEADPLDRILTHIGEPRGPPAWEDPLIDAVPDWDTLAQPQPEYMLDQQVQW